MTFTARTAPLVLAVLLAAPLTACGSSDDASSDRTTTTERTATTDATTDGETTDDEATDTGDEVATSDPEGTDAGDEPFDGADLGDLTAVPEDDGGKLCDAIDAWDEANFQGADDDSPQTAGATYEQAAAALRTEVAAATPDALADDLEAFADVMEAAGKGLQAYDGEEEDPEAMMADELVPELNALLDLAQPREVRAADGSTVFAYTNRFSAWANDPCGPKALAVPE